MTGGSVGDSVLWGLAGFAVGVFVGALLNPLERLRLGVAWTIVGLWVVSVIADGIVPDYNTPPTLNALALTVAGFLFGPSLLRPKNGEP